MEEKINNKNMNTKLETLKIVYYNGKKWTLKKVKAERITIEGIECMIFEEPEKDYWGAFNGWNVTHLATGMRCRNGLTREEAIRRTRKAFKDYPNHIKKGIKKIESIGIKYPVNI